jgi:hypothetical protein
MLERFHEVDVDDFKLMRHRQNCGLLLFHKNTVLYKYTMH